MVESLELRGFAWALTTLLELLLLLYLLRRQMFRSHPFFSAYILATVLESPLVALSSRHWDAHSIPYFAVAWGSQAAVVAARWLAAREVADRVLAGYPGIWGLARRTLLVLGVVMLTYTVALSRNRWDLAVSNADRAVELSLGPFLVGLFLVARYYRLTVADLERRLAVGLCLLSCTWVINNSISESWRETLRFWWEFLSILSFLASLVLWISALRRPLEAEEAAASAPLAREMYANLSEQLDSRLHMLNHRLNQLLRSEDSRTWPSP